MLPRGGSSFHVTDDGLFLLEFQESALDNIVAYL